MAEYIQIQKNSKNINLMVNGPKQVVKVVKYAKPCNEESLFSSSNDWSVERYDGAALDSSKRPQDEIKIDAIHDAELEASRAVREKVEKHQKVLKGREIARSRLHAAIKKKTEAFQTILENYASKFLIDRY